MLVAPKTVEAAFTLQNDYVRFDIANGVDGFNWIGLAAAMLQGNQASRMLFNVCDLWEIVLVEATGDILTERFKVITPAGVTATVETDTNDERAMMTLTWGDIHVDGPTGDARRDKLTVVVELELRMDEKFLRGRISAFWAENRPSTATTPGRYAIWRVRFPVADVTPAHANAFSDVQDRESEDVLFVPENHGVLVKGPTTAIGDAHLGVWSPQDRAAQTRNVVRPGATWRQGHPGLSSTQVMGYYGERTGRGILIGTMDRLGRIKELCAEAGDDTVRMSVLHTPEWCYSLGNRPNAFTGSTVGDSIDGRDALPAHPPQSLQDLPDLDWPVPNTRDLEVGGQRTASTNTASLGLMQFGRNQLGISGTVINTLADMGFASTFDVVIAPVKGFGPQGWNAIARLWREMAERPDSAFPLQELRDDAVPPVAAGADVLLEVDASIHDGQESLLGLDEADFAAAHLGAGGVVTDAAVVHDLIVPRTVVPLRTAVSQIEIFGEGDLVFRAPLLGPDGAPAGIQRAPRDDGRGYLRLFGKPNFYIPPEQLLHNDSYQGYQSIGRMRFRSLNPREAGVKVGDFVKVISDFQTYEPYGGRAHAPIGSDSELYPTNQLDQLRIVVGFGVDSNTIVVGRYEGGQLVPHSLSPAASNSAPGLHFEVEILREEANFLMLYPTEQGRFVRLQINLNADIIGAIFPETALEWAEVVDVGGVEYEFHRFIVDSGVAYIEFDRGGKPVSEFNGKKARLRRRFAPLDLFIEEVTDGDHVVLDGVKVNDRVRVLAMDAPWASSEAKLSDGWLEFDRPLVDEPAGSIQVSVFQGVSAAGRLLDAESDLAGGGYRFVDTGIESVVAGGFGAVVIPGDLVLIQNATEPGNAEPFEVAEVLAPGELRMTRQFAPEAAPPGGFEYMVVRPGKSFRDANFGGRNPQDLLAGPRRLLLGGQDRVHFLSIGWLKNNSLPVTGVFGVDSTAWADLGANPFIPAGSVNLTSYSESEWGTRKPSAEFPIAGYRDGVFTLAKPWAFESPSFSVEFSDEGVKTFEKNALQYRVVRDLRADGDATDFRGTKRSIDLWKTALEATAVVALIRGWQPAIRGFDRPWYAPPRGKYAELLAALDAAGHVHVSALDLHGLDEDEAGHYERLNLIAAAYWNRFGEKGAPAIGDASGERDQIFAPLTKFARDFMLAEVLEELVADGVDAFMLDGLERGLRDDYGSPRFFRPASQGEGSPTTFEISPSGGGSALAEGWHRLLDAVRRPAGVSQPMDWLLGPTTFSSKDWASIDRELPTTQIPFPVSGSFRFSLAGATVVGSTLCVPGIDFARLRANLYGEEIGLQRGDWLKLWPDTPGYMVISDVGVGLTVEGELDIAGESEAGVFLVRKMASDRIAAAPFFRFAFGAYATVAADVTFLASDISWQEVVSQRGAGISEEEYQGAVTQAFGRSMYRIGANIVAGLLPSVRVSSEAARRVPPDRYGFAWTRAGTNSLVEQAGVLFRESGRTYPLVQMHLSYLRYLLSWAREYPQFFRFGEPDMAPVAEGAASLLLDEVPLSTIGRSRSAIASGAFRDANGDILRVFTNWAAAPFAEQRVESIESDLSFAELGISEGYWTTVEVRLGLQNVWLDDLVDVSAAPSSVLSYAFDVRPLEMKAFLCYRQHVTVRRDAAGDEVDRVLIVPRGKSVAAAFQVISEDLPNSTSGRYVVVVGAGAIQDGLAVPSIPGATIEVQSSADETPTIGESA